MIRSRAKASCAVLSLLLGACASQTPSLTHETGSLAPPPAPVVQNATQNVAQNPPLTVTQLPKGPGYQLKAEELALDCKKLTGRMAIRIVQIRDFQSRMQTTSASRTIQSTTTNLFGGSLEGTDPDGRYARDRAMLEAYNGRLAEKSCANFDLDAELAPGATEPPRTRPLKKT